MEGCPGFILTSQRLTFSFELGLPTRRVYSHTFSQGGYLLQGLYRSFGAVVDDVGYEVNCLDTIALRNRHVAINPLSDYFFADLLAPLDRRDVIRRRPEWQEMALSLARFIETTLGRYWEIEGACRRNVYCWRRAEVVERWDYPAWAQRAATNLMYKAYSIFKRGGEADADDGNLLMMARQYTRYGLLIG
ncbi:hypothetical protein WS62_03885 [Burkholderia sp. ABCPW 14]|nr:hypothetical protein WS62_03885 [Burkholderia sp. ABCPW 14]